MAASGQSANLERADDAAKVAGPQRRRPDVRPGVPRALPVSSASAAAARGRRREQRTLLFRFVAAGSDVVPGLVGRS